MDRVDTADILRAFLDTNSYEDTAKRFGMTATAVRGRLDYHMEVNFGRDWKKRLIREKMEQLLDRLEHPEWIHEV